MGRNQRSLRTNYDSAFRQWADFVADLDTARKNGASASFIDAAQLSEAEAHHRYQQSRNRLVALLLASAQQESEHPCDTR